MRMIERQQDTPESEMRETKKRKEKVRENGKKGERDE